MLHYIKNIVILFICFLIIQCNNDNEYANHPAFFRYENVSTNAPLYEALTGYGSFCIIHFDIRGFSFLSNHGNSYFRNYTRNDQLSPPTAIAGLIIGTPSLPDFETSIHSKAYDGVCPNCYKELDLVRSLNFSKENPLQVQCSNCKRIYNLNNNGIVVNQKGHSLFQYRIQYDQNRNIVVVAN